LDTAFLSRTLRASLFLTALAYLLLSYYRGGPWALGFALGSLWSAANFFLLRQLIVRIVTLEERAWSTVAFLTLVKFPLLYLAGYLVLSQSAYPVEAPLFGFGLPFMVLVLKAGGRMILGLEGPDAGRNPRSLLGRR